MILQQTDNTVKNRIYDLYLYAVTVTSGCIFLLVASSWTSPLFKDAYGYDAAWYSTMGRAIVKGLTPYKDLFDLKGPVFFFYEALGELIIPGRGGIFLLQLISMTVTVIFLIKICRIYLNRRLSYLTLLLFFWPYVHLLWGGNTVEELFMPFNMAAIYLGLLYLNKTEEEAALSYEVKRAGLIYGIGAAVFALSKLTVGAPLFAMTLLIIIVMIKEKRFISLKNSIIWFLLGVLLVAVPTFAYFIMRGALADMIKAVFILGFKRSTDYYISFSSEWERQLLICPAALLTGILLSPYKKDDDKEVPGKEERTDSGNKHYVNLRFSLICMSVTVYLLLHLGSAYTYYFITLLPLWMLNIVYIIANISTLIINYKPWIFKSNKDNNKVNIKQKRSPALIKKTILTIIALIPAISIIFMYKDEFEFKMSENADLIDSLKSEIYVNHSKSIIDLVPEWERDELFDIESGMIFYEITGEIPRNKYPVNLPYFMALDREVNAEFKDLLINGKPKWIVSEGLDILQDEECKLFIYSNYELIADNSAEKLYIYIGQ